MSAALSTYKEREAERRRLADAAHERELLHDVSDAAPYVGMSVGISPGQASVVVLHAKNEHATVGGVHVALTEDGKIVVAVEAEPGTEIEVRRTIRRPRWRFYDFWRFDKDKHDNFIRPESEWPEITEIAS